MFKKIFEDFKEQWSYSSKNLKSTKALVLTALLMAMQVVLAPYSINLIPGVLKISFGFIPVSILCYLLGPAVGAVAGGVCDILKYIVAPDGAFFIGYTISEIVTGLIYGFFLYRKEITLPRIFACKFTVNLILNIILTPLWLHIMLGKAWAYYAGLRIVKNLILWPVESLILYYVLKYTKKSIGKYAVNNFKA